MARIYLASSWRNEQQPTVLAALRAAGHEVYDFRNPKPDNTGFSWREIDPDWERWTPAQLVAAYAHPLAVEGLGLDFDAMKWADTFVMLQPCGRSAALELGWGVGAGKRTAVLLADGQEPELMIRLAELVTPDLAEVLRWLGNLAASSDNIGNVALLRAQLDACSALVDYLADRVIDDADLGYYIGPGTQTLHLLIEAVAALEGGDRQEIKRDLSQPHKREPDVVRYRKLAETFQLALEKIRDGGEWRAHELAVEALEEVA